MKTYKSRNIERLYLFAEKTRNFWVMYKQSLSGMIGLIMLTTFIIMAVFAPWIALHDPNCPVGKPWTPPNNSNLLGTEELGRDVFSRLVYSARTSLLVGFVAAFMAVFIGTLVGLFSGYLGGAIDNLLMRATDLFLMMPGIPFMIVLASIFGANLLNIILAIAITGWARTARIIRSSTLTLKTREYVEVAKSVGAGPINIIYRHILPNVLPLIFAVANIQIASSILSEAGIAFLGLMDPLTISWGLMLHYAFEQGALMGGAWWYVFPPGICISLVAISFVFISRAVDKIVNPRLRER